MHRAVLRDLIVHFKTPAVWLSGDDFYFNKAAEGLIGYTNKEVPDINTWFQVLYADEWETIFSYYLESKKQNFQAPFESVILHKNGSIKHVKFSRHINENCEMWWISDFTEQKNFQTASEFEIRNLNTAMLEVQRLQKKLKQENKKLKRSNRELEDFAYIASHDLKEPLRKITNFSGRLRTKYSRGLDETAQVYIERMEVASTRMQLLIDDLLKYSRVSRTEIQTTRLDMVEVIATVEDKLDTLIKETNTHIIKKTLLPCQGNESLVVSLFQNLVTNGIKFQKEDTSPKITIDSEEIAIKKRKYIRYTIEDNGIGIKEEYQKRIFKIFERLHSKDEFKGTGIGLAIVKRIIEKHNGKISVYSEIDKGSTFTLDFPI